MDELHSEEKGGLTLKIFQDEDARQPDEGPAGHGRGNKQKEK